MPKFIKGDQDDSDLGHWLIEGRFVCVNGYTAAIVASVHVAKVEPGAGWRGDWSAYWGGYSGFATEEDTVRWISRHGAKMREEDARYFFFGETSVERKEFGNLPYRD